MEDVYDPFRLSDESKKHIRKYSPYQVEYTINQYQRGKMYSYEAVEPYPGLVLTIQSNGFGSGESDSYIVLNAKKKSNTKTSNYRNRIDS